MLTKDGFRIFGWSSFLGSSNMMCYTVNLIKGFDKKTLCSYNCYDNGKYEAVLPF